MTRQEFATGYTPDSVWRHRAEFLSGRKAIVQFLARKWARELDYRLIKELWAFYENRIAVRFAYEWRDDSGHWFRSYGNENWEFDGNGSPGSPDREHQRSALRRPDSERSFRPCHILAESRRPCSRALDEAVTKMTAGSITSREDER